MIKESNKWINYKIPPETLATLPWGNKYVGQTQKWFAFRFNGNESEINVVLIIQSLVNGNGLITIYL